jgi:hypothetical protein
MTHDDLAWFQWEPPVKVAVSLTWQWAHSVCRNKPVSRTRTNGVLRAGVFRRHLITTGYSSSRIPVLEYSSKKKKKRAKSRKTRVPGVSCSDVRARNLSCRLSSKLERRFTQAADPAAANPCEVYRGELKNYNEKIEHNSSPLAGSWGGCPRNSS